MAARWISLARSLVRGRHRARPMGSGSDLPIFGHRGASARAPENTLAAFERCAAAGVGIELDVGRSVDGALYVLHDETVDRTTDGVGRLRDLRAEQIDELDAGSWFDEASRGERVPRLDEVLRRYAGVVPLDIELKSDPDPVAVALRLIACLAGHPTDAVLITSFDPFVLGAVADLRPDLLRGQIVSSLRDADLPAGQRYLLRTMRFNAVSRPDVIMAEDAILEAPFVRRCARRGWPIVAWTVDTAERARTLRAMGVAGLISNDPERLAAELDGRDGVR